MPTSGRTTMLRSRRRTRTGSSPRRGGRDCYLQDGELVGIIGPNGAGKSTLLKALFGLIPVRSGAVTLRGEDITSAPAHRLVSLGVGYVPQNNNVFPSLTLEENMQMG